MWYDSEWLGHYRRALDILAGLDPAMAAEFRAAMRVFATRADFRAKRVPRPFEAATLEAIRAAVAALRPADLKLHEARTFGRYVVHDHPRFTQVQQEAAALVGTLVGEPVEPCYNFLSLYSPAGVCPLHVDAPFAKWTVDLCLERSSPWPIHFSPVQPWESLLAHAGDAADWERRVRAQTPFESFASEPGEAIVFSGSSQWHYRDPMPPSPSSRGATMLFLHYIPRGSAELAQPERWADLFGVPELALADVTV